MFLASPATAPGCARPDSTSSGGCFCTGRPGRVDQAVEIRLPDPEARRRLLQLYGERVDMQVTDIEMVVARTDGVTASFIKELIRRAALVAAGSSSDSGRLTVTDEHIAHAL